MHRIPILILLLTSAIIAFSQQYLYQESYDVDSLLLILPGQDGEEQVNTLNDLAISLSFQDFELCKRYADEAMVLANEINYREGVAAAYRNLGHLNFYRNNYPDALNNYFEALRIYEKSDQRNTMGQVYWDISKTHYLANNFEKVFEYGNMALAIYRERLENGATVGCIRDTFMVIGGFGLAYVNMGMNDKALETRLKLLEVGKQNNFGMTELMLYEFLAGTDYYKMGETDSAKAYFIRALAYPDANPDIEALKYSALTWLGYVYRSAGEFDSAVSCLHRAFDWYHEKGFLYWAMYVSRGLGVIYNQNNQLNIAEKYYQQSERIFREMLKRNSWYRYDSLKFITSYGLELYFPMPPKRMKEMMWELGKWIYGRLYQINVAKRRTSEALKYHILYAEASDTLSELQRNRETIELQTRYESEQKERQIELLAQENSFTSFKLKQSRYFLIGLGVLVLLVITLAIVLIRQNRLREQQKNMILQQKLFRSQMNPHFLFNSLVGIQQFIINQEPARAVKFLSKFSKLVRNILDSSFEEYVPLEEEINTVENYLELQKVRYTEKFDYSIDVNEAIDTEAIQIPPMLAQPIIENSVEHGIKHKETKGNIHIRFRLNDNRLVFEVEDDGVGRQKAMEMMMEQDKDHKSLAIAITLERIRLLNKKLKHPITMNILDLKNDKNEPAGTRVTFEMPIIN